MQKQILEAIIDEPVLIKEILLKRSFLDKLIGIQKSVKLELRAPTARTSYKLTNLILDIDKDFGDGHEFIANNTHQLALIVATAIHNQNTPIPDKLVDIILDNFTVEELKAICKEVYRRLDVHSFFDIWESLQKMKIVSDIQETTPLGQD